MFKRSNACARHRTGKVCETLNGICEATNPCKNGAHCRNVDNNGFKCFCTLGFKGPDCSLREDFDDTQAVRFTGDGYLAISGDLFPHVQSMADEVVRAVISTQEDSGLILFHGQTPEINGQDKDFFAIALIDGFVEFSFELGSGPARIRSDVRVNDGLKHTVVVKRKGKEGSLEVDGIHQTYGMSSGTLQALNAVGDIYIGGLPDFSLMVGNRFDGFVGCISDLEVGTSGAINLVTAARKASNVLTCDDE